MSTLRNNVKLIGHVGKDPEVRTFDGGRKMATFTIATNDSYKNPKGEKIVDTQWHTLVVWGKLADVAGQYIKKGNEVAVEGKLVHKVYETSAGEKRYVTEINVKEMLMLKGKQE
ncbi:MAG TPA: single-stranded DNA-binding protein [Chryseolinea sp.]|jgi:single-strand DNA-binding protein|nr:single-stranded DNA-binding protein [Chryseolinea sp.]